MIEANDAHHIEKPKRACTRARRGFPWHIRPLSVAVRTSGHKGRASLAYMRACARVVILTC